MELTRNQGYATDFGSYVEGATVISAPILDFADQVVSTVAAVGLTQRVDTVGVQTIANALVQIAGRARGMGAVQQG